MSKCALCRNGHHHVCEDTGFIGHPERGCCCKPRPAQATLTPDGVRGLAAIAIDARLAYTSGDVVVDEVFYEAAAWLAEEVQTLRQALANYIELYPTCPCGAWTDNPDERPHVIGCPVGLVQQRATA